ncbi:MAG: hypothetical protein JWQ84_464 [Mucilaginibacter sp.]|nr:hypothetical protein [Mucilaginibacter sp.]MDB5138852.1 hypothetical protein [Mucilaginibacter sp.]
MSYALLLVHPTEGWERLGSETLNHLVLNNLLCMKFAGFDLVV